jgi:hypothetical protein
MTTAGEIPCMIATIGWTEGNEIRFLRPGGRTQATLSHDAIGCGETAKLRDGGFAVARRGRKKPAKCAGRSECLP